jgi:hypothetical protein
MMVAHRVGLATVIALVVLASCALPRPDVGLTISGTTVPSSHEGSYCQGGGCQTMCADGPAPVATLTVVRTSTPVRLEFVAPSEIDQIHGDIWQGEKMTGSPVESFTIDGAARSYVANALKTGGRYYIVVMTRWNRVIDRGDSSRAFLIEIANP